MTREEILDEVIAKPRNGKSESLQWIDRNYVLEAMDEYAKQRSIAFNLWSDNNAVRTGQDEWTVGTGISTKLYTSEQLYNLFEEHLKQQSK